MKTTIYLRRGFNGTLAITFDESDGAYLAVANSRDAAVQEIALSDEDMERLVTVWRNAATIRALTMPSVEAAG